MPKITLIEYVKMPKLALLESIPQTHILLCLAGQNPTLIIGKDSAEFVVTFASSFLSASFALSKFLKTVPDVGRLGGFFEIIFFKVTLL